MSDIVMTVKKFLDMAQLAYELPSCYVTGCFGAPLALPGVIERWEDEYPQNKKHDELIRERAAEGAYGWDCVNYIKALLWQWHADPTQEYGGAVYKFAGIPDATVYDLFNRYCYGRDDNFENIIPGAMLYYGNGSHCGIYAGGGYALEATGSWGRKIEYSAVENLADRYPEIMTYDKKRKWQGWGLLPWIDYAEENEMSVKHTIICPCCGRAMEAEISLKLSPDEILAVHTVEPNDTPWGIARKYYGDGSKYYIIMEYNGLPRDAYIHTGQILKIPRR